MKEKAPLYRVLYETLRDLVAKGRFEVGAPFPSENELSRTHGVSRITVRHALRLLTDDGFIETTRARRSIVKAIAPAHERHWTVESIDDIIAMVEGARIEVASWRIERSPRDAEMLGLAARQPLHCLRSVLLRGEKPILRSVIYFPPAVGARLKRAMFDDVIVFRVLGRELGIILADVGITVWPELADTADAKLLLCSAGAPLLVTQLLYRAKGGEPVEIAYSRRCGPDALFSTRISAHKKRT